MLPPVRVFHLKRFARLSGPRGRKLAFHVPFPGELDMPPYALSESLYDLGLLVVHNGGLHNAHNVACVRIDDMWYCFHDLLRFQSDSDAVYSRKDGLFFYERREDIAPDTLDTWDSAFLILWRMTVPASPLGFFVAFFPVGLNYKRSGLFIDFDPGSPRLHSVE
jgi:hypothetical protein